MEPFPRTDHNLSSASPSSSQTPTNITEPAFRDSHPIEDRLVALIRENITHVHRSPSTLRGVALEICEERQPPPQPQPQPPRDTSRRLDSVPLIHTMAETMSPIGIANVRIADSSN